MVQVVVAVALTFLSCVQTLELTKIADFPLSVTKPSSVYDGDGGVYIFGGMHSTEGSPHAFLYSIEEDGYTLLEGSESVGEVFEGKAALYFDNRIIYHLSITSNPLDRKILITKIDRTNNSFGSFALNHTGLFGPTFIVPLEDRFLLFDRSLNWFGPKLFEVLITGEDEFDGPIEKGPVRELGFQWDIFVHIKEINSVVIVSPGGRTMLDLGTLQFTNIPGDFPYLQHGFRSVFDGSHVYTVGLNSPVWGIEKLNPFTFESTILEVPRFPLDGILYSAVVYAERFNRIYIFGGENFNQSQKAQSYYIQL